MRVPTGATRWGMMPTVSTEAMETVLAEFAHDQEIGSGQDELAAVLVARCQNLERDHQQLRACTRYQWWPQEPRPRKST